MTPEETQDLFFTKGADMFMDSIPTDTYENNLNMKCGWWKETQRMIDRGYERCKAKYGWQDDTFRDQLSMGIRESQAMKREATKAK